MSESVLVLLCGEIGSGKTTAANILKKYGFHEETFAEPLKQTALALGFPRSSVYGTQAEKLAVVEYFGISGREFMQQFGTEVCRDDVPKRIPNLNLHGYSFWVNLMHKKLQESRHSLIVISDGRTGFEDEARMVREKGGIVILLKRDQTTSSETKHVSETDVVVPDVCISNNSSLNNLERSLIEAIKTHLPHAQLPARSLPEEQKPEYTFDHVHQWEVIEAGNVQRGMYVLLKANNFCRVVDAKRSSCGGKNNNYKVKMTGFCALTSKKFEEIVSSTTNVLQWKNYKECCTKIVLTSFDLATKTLVDDKQQSHVVDLIDSFIEFECLRQLQNHLEQGTRLIATIVNAPIPTFKRNVFTAVKLFESFVVDS